MNIFLGVKAPDAASRRHRRRPALAPLALAIATMLVSAGLPAAAWAQGRQQTVAMQRQNAPGVAVGSSSGSFAAIDFGGAALADGLVWDTSRLYTAGEIGITAVPEPGIGLLMAMGLAALGWRTRRAPLPGAGA